MSGAEFTGRAQAYTKTRPGYPKEAMEYIYDLMPQNAVIADIGAGTGKFTEMLAVYGNKMYAVEPNADMLAQLAVTLAHFANVEIIGGSAEATMLLNSSVDAITNAQALNWFDIGAFRKECLRIGKENPLVITLYNCKKGEINSRYESSTRELYKNPLTAEFDNPVYFTKENWILYLSSMAGVPQPQDAGYEAHIAKTCEAFDRNSENGLLHLNLVTRVYSERLG